MVLSKVIVHPVARRHKPIVNIVGIVEIEDCSVVALMLEHSGDGRALMNAMLVEGLSVELPMIAVEVPVTQRAILACKRNRGVIALRFEHSGNSMRHMTARVERAGVDSPRASRNIPVHEMSVVTSVHDCSVVALTLEHGNDFRMRVRRMSSKRLRVVRPTAVMNVPIVQQAVSAAIDDSSMMTLRFVDRRETSSDRECREGLTIVLPPSVFNVEEMQVSVGSSDENRGVIPLFFVDCRDMLDASCGGEAGFVGMPSGLRIVVHKPIRTCVENGSVIALRLKDRGDVAGYLASPERVSVEFPVAVHVIVAKSAILLAKEYFGMVALAREQSR